MSDHPTISATHLVAAAAGALRQRREEVDRLNVFPVPDGDTGTNMSLTMDEVVAEVGALQGEPSTTEVCHAATHGSLMGARGNSGVILSQIIRGISEVLSEAPLIDGAVVRDALERSVTVAFQAVRKPVEGTMLTVLRDAAAAAAPAVAAGQPLEDVLAAIVEAAYASVQRTPELLPVLKENGVVDAGGYGLAILMDGLASAASGAALHTFEPGAPGNRLDASSVVPSDDWDDDRYSYCTEFLVFGQGIDADALAAFVAASGGSELVVGGEGVFRVHVHTDDPASVLAYATGLGEIAEVHVHNMRRQAADRNRKLAEERQAAGGTKPLGFVAVASGAGLVGILRSLGVDRVVEGGQTMNPSTAQLLAAIEATDAEAVILLPDNSNIIMAAQQTVGVSSKPVGVVPTTSVPQAFAAMLAADSSLGLEANVEAMTAAARRVRTGEVTVAVKDATGRVGAISAGQVIGIADHEIVAVGTDVTEVTQRLLDVIIQDGQTLTLLAGRDLSDADMALLTERLSSAHPELDIDAHRGDQPVYPVIISVE